MKNNDDFKKASIFKILTNSTANVISIIFLAFLIGQFIFVNLNELYLIIIVIALIIGDLALIVVVTYIEYRYTFLILQEDKLIYHQPLNKKKCFEEDYQNIQALKVVTGSLLIEFKNQRVLLDYYAKAEELKNLIEQKRAH